MWCGFNVRGMKVAWMVSVNEYKWFVRGRNSRIFIKTLGCEGPKRKQTLLRASPNNVHTYTLSVEGLNKREPATGSTRNGT